MRYLLVSFLCYFARFFLTLRYKIKVKGKTNLKSKNFRKNIGTLFLPNHPALVDPIIVAILLWPKFKMRPLVVEYVYRQSGINLIMRLLKALPVPNLDTSLNEVKIKNAKGVVEKIIKGLKEKKNYILYPAGRLKHTGKEILGGASATQNILSSCPDANIVLIRSTGFWGSSFSRAYSGRSPDFKKTLIRNLKNLFLCFIFFMPKRKILLEMEIAPNDFPVKGSRLEINKYLENWYNQYKINDKILEEEPINLVSYSCFKEKFYEKKEKSLKKKVEEKTFSSETEKKVFFELSRLQPDIEIKPQMNLATDLGLDSLDVAELISFLTLHFDVGEIHPEDIETVQDVLEVAEGRKVEKREKLETSFHWTEEKNRPALSMPDSPTIFQAFLEKADSMKNFIACADDMLGVFSYKKLKLSAILLAGEIQKMPGKYIGVLLPASVASYIVVFAIMLAKKIPVMLNWTSGPRFLNHMADVTNMQTVISSWKFLERISNVEFGDILKKMCLLEDVFKDVSIKSKAKAFFLSLRSAKRILKILNLQDIGEDSIATILFTSGTEANPKGVPLSHKNILSNQRAAAKCVRINEKDIMLGILPPFHSFGFSVAGIFPILYGIKIAFSPDPTDSFTLSEAIERWKITILCAAPSFLKGVLLSATKKQLKTLHLFVTGAEKTSKDIFEKVKNLGNGKIILEGYGITECSPMLSMVRENEKPIGVGKPFSGIDFCTIDPETRKSLSSNHLEGELCVRGPNIFSGYLEKPKKDPFINIDGKKWYCTGDLGFVDNDGNIILSGRLKRFSKIGGEMVSLGSIEEIILKELSSQGIDIEKASVIAVCALEKDGGKSELVLFSTIDLNQTDVNKMLKKAGCSRLIKISKIKKIDQIPLMGTGKVDYRFLQKMIT